jgi:hypothetical protein
VVTRRSRAVFRFLSVASILLIFKGDFGVVLIQGKRMLSLLELCEGCID